MAWMLTIGYLTVAVAAAGIVFVVSDRLGDQHRPLGQRTGLSLAAGLLWPLILLGLAEYGSIAVYAKVHGHHDDREAEREPVLVRSC